MKERSRKATPMRQLDLLSTFGKTSTLPVKKYQIVCCICGRIRNSRGRWVKRELNTMNTSDLNISHGYCPRCAKQKFPEYF